MRTNIHLMKSKRTVRIKRLTLYQHSRVSVENDRLSCILKYYRLNKKFVKIRSTVCAFPSLRTVFDTANT